MNSLRSLQLALAHEIERQTALAEAGEPILQETRHWDEEAGATQAGRSKEQSSDYRYFPEPDLVPVQVDDEHRERILAELPPLPARLRARYREMGADPDSARLLADPDGLGAAFEQAVEAGADGAAAANWLTGEVVALLRRRGEDPSGIDGAALAELLAMIDAGELSVSAAKTVLAGVLDGEGSPRRVAEARDLMQVADPAALEEAVDRVIAEHPEELQRMQEGDQRLIGFFVGQVMRVTGGKADPKAVAEMVRTRAAG
jgi:aspartyl-tRNA(Asn)/glutamyl-tRNA(Gln) amidotransferase subunit B